jgi:hypothetical protein
MKEIRNAARNVRKYLEKDVKYHHLTTHQRGLLQMLQEVFDERRRNSAARLAPTSRGHRFDSMPLGRPGAPESGGRGCRGRGRVVVWDARALICQNDMRCEFRDAIDIACDYYREERRAADNESAYWGGAKAF